ncbi:MAG: hypothetical protein JWQ48_966 [Conexibacter sp.]|nr:hypothetical protein [Conexibacter sp.]
MAPLVADRIERPLTLFGELVEDREQVATTPSREDVAAPYDRDGVGGEPTLDDLVVGAWEGLTAQAAAACPLCDAGTLRPLPAVDGTPFTGCCDRCGTTLT